jgi:hypothetical protein
VSDPEGPIDRGSSPDPGTLRFFFWRQIITPVSWVLGILATALPLSVVKEMVEPFAGEATFVDANFGLTVTISVSLAANTVLAIKIRRQRAEIQRLRRRLEAQGWQDGDHPGD